MFDFYIGLAPGTVLSWSCFGEINDGKELSLCFRPLSDVAEKSLVASKPIPIDFKYRLSKETFLYLPCSVDVFPPMLQEENETLEGPLTCPPPMVTEQWSWDSNPGKSGSKAHFKVP